MLRYVPHQPTPVLRVISGFQPGQKAREVVEEEARELAAMLARDLVQRVAPEELPIFRATSRAYFASSGKRRYARSQDEMLGFGIESAAVLVTPVVLELCRGLLDALTDEVADTGTGIRKEVLANLKAWLTERQERRPVQFNQPQLQHIREVTERTADKLRLPTEQVRLLVDALVDSLATSTAGGAP